MGRGFAEGTKGSPFPLSLKARHQYRLFTIIQAWPLAMYCAKSTPSTWAVALTWSTCLASAAAHLGGDIPLGTAFGIPGDNATYDYVIVGGGNAGLTLATRLAEQQSGRVAVVEAGGFYEISNGNYSQVPATDGYFASTNKRDWQPLIDWGYVTTPQAVSIISTIEEVCHVPVLG